MNFEKLIKWLRSSFEGKDGRSSARALTNWWYVGLNTILSLGVLVLVGVIVFAKEVNEHAISAVWALIWLVVIYNSTILLIYQIINMNNINDVIRSARGLPQQEYEKEQKADIEGEITITPKKDASNE